MDFKNAGRMVPRGGIEPPTQGFSVLCKYSQTLIITMFLIIVC